MKRKKKVIKGFDRSYEMKKADEAFSRYTRIRWSDKDGICTCITCGRMKHWKEVDAGHYRRREHQSTRFDEKNVHPQCRYCNFYRGGAEAEHREYIDSTYGDGTAYQIEQKSLMRSKRTAFDMHMIRKEYEQKLKDLCEERGIILKPTKKKASNEPEESQGESENKQGTAGDV
jgi:hypothetical protein